MSGAQHAQHSPRYLPHYPPTPVYQAKTQWGQAPIGGRHEVGAYPCTACTMRRACLRPPTDQADPVLYCRGRGEGGVAFREISAVVNPHGIYFAEPCFLKGRGIFRHRHCGGPQRVTPKSLPRTLQRGDGNVTPEIWMVRHATGCVLSLGGNVSPV